MARQPTSKNNHVAEWFGHRIYPGVSSHKKSRSDQQAQRCPFLSDIKETDHACIKTERSRGVCTVSSTSNGPRQDWVVCPYRAFDAGLVDGIARRLFNVWPEQKLWTHAAPTLEESHVQNNIPKRLRAGNRVLVYFDEKIGGEISLRGSEQSPEMSFDVTFVELLIDGNQLRMGRFGIVEIQTMDFHGSYGHAVEKLQMAVKLFPRSFQKEIAAHSEWASERVEGPNIANVVKRTFWQMFFKFEFGLDANCAGTALAIPQSVWDSWQPFLAKSELRAAPDGTYRLLKPGESLRESQKIPAWIYVFDIDASAKESPNPIVTRKIVGASADALGHYALVEAPKKAREVLTSAGGIYTVLGRRIRGYWPTELLAPL